MNTVTQELKDAIDKIESTHRLVYVDCDTCGGTGLSPITGGMCGMCEGRGKFKVLMMK